jgi:probable HAF family extracellular repeat protein
MSHWKSFALGIFAALYLLGGTAGSAHAQNWYAIEWSDGKAVDLRTLPGYTNAQAAGINDAGQAVGQTFGGLGAVATEWVGGSPINLGSLSGTTSGVASSINNAGEVVGTSYFSNSNVGIATEWTGGVGGSIINLGSLPGSLSSQALSINNAGVAVGESDVYTGVGFSLVATEWSHGSVIKLGGLPGSTSSEATGINDAGEIVGMSVVGGVQYAVEWSGGDIINLGALLGTTAIDTYEINNSGTAVGTSYLGNSNEPFQNATATEWSGGNVIDLGGLPYDGPLPPGFGSQALGINNAGAVVGSSTVGTSVFDLELVAAEWSGGNVIELPALPGEFEQSAARSINDFGQAVGYSYGQYVPPPPPIPELSTWAMMLLGFGGLGLAGYRLRST